MTYGGAYSNNIWVRWSFDLTYGGAGINCSAPIFCFH